MTLASFIAGTMVGVFIGIFVAALCAVAQRSDDPQTAAKERDRVQPLRRG